MPSSDRAHYVLQEYIDCEKERELLRAEVLRLNAQYYEMDTYGCPDCNGDGEIRGITCFTCNGHSVLFTKPKEAIVE